MPYRILLIDDDADIRMLLTMMLQGEGYTVIGTNNGRDGLALLRADDIDAVILDIMLPEMNGWKVCEQIKTTPATSHIPVLIFTVRSQLHDGNKYIASGADGFINKPFDKEELFQTLAKVLARDFN